MHVFIIPSWYTTKENPIRGIFFKEQAQAIQNAGIKVTILYSELQSLKKFKYEPTITSSVKLENEDGLNTYRYISYNFLPRVPYYNYYKHYKQLRELFNMAKERYGRPDVIHAHSYLSSGVVAAKIAQEEKIPLVVTEHSSAFIRGMIKKYQVPIIKKAVRKTDSLIAVSEGLKKEMKQYSGNKQIETIPNIVNVQNFSPHSSKKDERSKFVFFSLGNLDFNKGMDLLINAFSDAFKGNDDVVLRIGGDGQELKKLENLVYQLDIEHKVQFLGRLNREQVTEEMTNCDVFALASRHETFGVVYIEALACGKPIIATKSGGPNSIVTMKNGLISPTEDIKDLTKNFQKMYYNVNNYDSNEIRNDCLEKYSEKKIAKNIIEIYEKNQEKY